SFDKLMRFLDSLGIPIIAVLRDSQSFVQAAEAGIGICDMQPHKVKKDLEQLELIIEWLNGWRERRRSSMDPGSVHHATNVTTLHKPNVGSG
ncbi:MAG TPA: hypothetical protein VGA68_04970, partial [Woeseiaceae bacterium]